VHTNSLSRILAHANLASAVILTIIMYGVSLYMVSFVIKLIFHAISVISIIPKYSIILFLQWHSKGRAWQGTGPPKCLLCPATKDLYTLIEQSNILNSQTLY